MKFKFTTLDARKIHDELYGIGVPVKGITVGENEVEIEVNDNITTTQKENMIIALAKKNLIEAG